MHKFRYQFSLVFSLTFVVSHSGTSMVTEAHEGHEYEQSALPRLSESVLIGSNGWEFQTQLTTYATTDAAPALGIPMHGGVATDRQGNVYATLQTGKQGLIVFRNGAHLPELIAPGLAGGHSLLLRNENEIPYLYFCRDSAADVHKIKLNGESVWKISRDTFEQIPDIYEGTYINWKGEEVPKEPVLTSVAVGPDDTIYVADGYGQQYIHMFDRERQYIKSFGGRGKEPGKFIACHGITLDKRYEPPRLLICDRENHRLQHFSLDGSFIEVAAENLRRPCCAAISGEYVAIAELAGRVTVLDKENRVAVHLGTNDHSTQSANYSVPPSLWRTGVFTAPHGVCWDGDDLIISEWSESGRLTRLERIK